MLKTFTEFAMDEEPSTWEILHGVTLIKPQLKTLLSVIDVSTETGLRDYVLIAFCYTTGARVSELTGIRLKDIIKQGRRSR